MNVELARGEQALVRPSNSPEASKHLSASGGSNVQRRMKNEYPIPNIQRLFLFLCSPSTPLRAVSLSNGRFDTRNENHLKTVNVKGVPKISPSHLLSRMKT
jgi:hypothetical protein